MMLRITVGAVSAALALTVAASEGQAGGGTPFTGCGQVATTNVFLTGSWYCPGEDGIVVAAAGITIDLKGFRLRGDRSTGNHGIQNPGFNEVTIKNGVIRNFDDGVHSSGASDSLRISSLLVSGNASNGISVTGDSVSVKSSTSAGNAGVGVLVGGAAATVQSSTSSGNQSAGFNLSGDSVSIKSSRAFGNNGHGIIAVGTGAKVLSSTAVGNALNGILVLGDAALIKANRTEANGFAGGVSDANGYGIEAAVFTISPVGTNVARGNDALNDCTPSSLC
jgi:hypothetical protein